VEPEKIKSVLVAAQNKYHRLSQTGEWTGVSAKAKEMAFSAAHITCHNCEGPNHLKDSSKPQNKVAIDQNKLKFKSNLGGRGQGRDCLGGEKPQKLY
jgi:hypothetical protein